MQCARSAATTGRYLDQVLLARPGHHQRQPGALHQRHRHRSAVHPPGVDHPQPAVRGEAVRHHRRRAGPHRAGLLRRLRAGHQPQPLTGAAAVVLDRHRQTFAAAQGGDQRHHPGIDAQPVAGAEHTAVEVRFDDHPLLIHRSRPRRGDQQRPRRHTRRAAHRRPRHDHPDAPTSDNRNSPSAAACATAVCESAGISNDTHHAADPPPVGGGSTDHTVPVVNTVASRCRAGAAVGLHDPEHVHPIAGRQPGGRGRPRRQRRADHHLPSGDHLRAVGEQVGVQHRAGRDRTSGRPTEDEALLIGLDRPHVTRASQLHHPNVGCADHLARRDVASSHNHPHRVRRRREHPRSDQRRQRDKNDTGHHPRRPAMLRRRQRQRRRRRPVRRWRRRRRRVLPDQRPCHQQPPCSGRDPVHVTRPFTSATANSADADVVYGASAPPAPVDDVHEIDHAISIEVWKW